MTPAAALKQTHIQAMFERAYRSGQIARFGALLGGARRLLRLSDAQCCRRTVNRYEAGLRAVAIRDIKGTTDRADDFDANFNPLHESDANRWMSVASAMVDDRGLPPVKLVEVDGVYFVEDGHHRISVARALRQSHIDAHVTVLELTGDRAA